MKRIKVSLLTLCTSLVSLALWSCAEEIESVKQVHSNLSFEVKHVEDVIKHVPTIGKKELQQMRLPATAIDLDKLTVKGSDNELMLSEMTTPRMPVDVQELSSRARFQEGINDIFNVWAFSSASSSPDILNKVKVSNVGTLMEGATWNPQNHNETARFTALYPAQENNYVVHSDYDNKVPSVTFTVNNDVTKQSELMWAISNYQYGSNENQEGQQVVPLTFYHALTAIRFKVGDKMSPGATLLSVKFKGIYSKGDFYPNQVNLSEQDYNSGWSNLSGNEGNQGVFAIENLNVPMGSREGDIILGKPDGSDEYTFLMIPQTLPQGAAVEIIVRKQKRDNQWENVKYTVDLSGKKWIAGTVKTYNITEQDDPYDYHFVQVRTTINAQGNQLAPDDNVIIGFESWRVSKEFGTIEYLPVEKAEYRSATNTDYADWLSYNIYGERKNIVNMSVNPIYVVDALEYARNLFSSEPYKGKQFYGSNPEDYYNLAINGSANSYIVNGPGLYMIPLVYGNCLSEFNVLPSYNKTSTENKDRVHKDSFNPYGDSSGYMYINAEGEIIKEGEPVTNRKGTFYPNLYVAHKTNDKDNVTVEVVSMDGKNDLKVKELFKETEDSQFSGIYAVGFSVNNEIESPGNYLLQVKRGTQLLWQYHIWVTPKMKVFNFANYNDYVSDQTKNLFSLGNNIHDPQHTYIVRKNDPIDDMSFWYGEYPLGWVPTSGKVIKNREDIAPTSIRFRQANKGGKSSPDNLLTVWLVPAYSRDLKGYAPQYISGSPWPYLDNRMQEKYGAPVSDFNTEFRITDKFNIQQILSSGSQIAYLCNNVHNENWFKNSPVRNSFLWDASEGTRQTSSDVVGTLYQIPSIKSIYDPTPPTYHAVREPEAGFITVYTTHNNPAGRGTDMFGTSHTSLRTLTDLRYDVDGTTPEEFSRTFPKGGSFYAPAYHYYSNGSSVTLNNEYLSFAMSWYPVEEASMDHPYSQKGFAAVSYYDATKGHWNINRSKLVDLGCRTGIMPLMKWRLYNRDFRP